LNGEVEAQMADVARGLGIPDGFEFTDVNPASGRER